MENTYENKKQFLKLHIGLKVLINGKTPKYTWWWHFFYGGTYRVKTFLMLTYLEDDNKYCGLSIYDLHRYGWISFNIPY